MQYKSRESSTFDFQGLVCHRLGLTSEKMVNIERLQELLDCGIIEEYEVPEWSAPANPFRFE